MGNIGTVSLLLLFGMGFSLYLGGSILGLELGTGFESFVGIVSAGNVNDIIDLLINSIVSAAGLGTLALSGIVGYATQSSRYVLAIVAISGLNFLFTPFIFINEATATIPTEIRLFVMGVFGILLTIAVLSFVMERDF